MAPVTTTGYLILGMLAERDWTAYEIAEQIGKGITELWPRATRQLYNVPKRLVDEGLANATVEAVGRRERTRYSITPAGQEALRDWLSTQPDPPALEFEGMLRVLLADDGTIDDLRSTLMAMEEQARSSRALFVAHARFMAEHDGGTHPSRRHLLAISNLFMVEHFDHIVDWAAWALAETETWEDTVSPATTHLEEIAAILERSIAIGTSETRH
jgi:DNA-binding PadR family transcriptional regulator